MEAIFLDLHIHTSSNPNNLNPNYDLELLKSKIDSFTGNSKYLISLTDHNTINTPVYLRAQGVFENMLVGVELNIRYYPESPAYHCHAYFKDSLTEELLNDLNRILDELYPDKKPSDTDQIPPIEDIIRKFDKYDFMLLPHGGQSHRTFDEAIPKGVIFDDALSKSIYYNQFDGFTARGVDKLQNTQKYFERLNINEFVNLMTCSDNYDPQNYPDCNNAREAQEFIPTWMFSAPTFDGLRLALSESSRLKYSIVKPIFEHNHIQGVKLNNDLIDIDVCLSPGLNVVIGESSSGKTLFVDSLFKKIKGEFTSSDYLKFGVEQMKVINPSGIKPHFLSQNYIMSIVKDAHGDLNKIAIVKDVFPGDSDLKIKIELGLAELRQDLAELISAVKEIEKVTESLSHLPDIQTLIVTNSVKNNIFSPLVPQNIVTEGIDFSEGEQEHFLKEINKIEEKLEKNPLLTIDKLVFDRIRNYIQDAHKFSCREKVIRNLIKHEHEAYEEVLMKTQRLDRERINDFHKLQGYITTYVVNYRKFKKVLGKISHYQTSCKTESVESEGHQLFIKNDFVLNKEKVKDVINELLKAPVRVKDLDDLEPIHLFEKNFSERPKVNNYDDFEHRVNEKFSSFNSKQYEITTSSGHDFSSLSPGWKTSIILDIILGYKDDMAPIIIDQPEDNLATSYINSGLVQAIKKIKEHKQIILVSHNATIPMMADAQKVILCSVINDKIVIRDGRLEDEVHGKSVVSHIAELTDGGKPSIKKRVKKYNLKNYKD